jgi:hypothetical protein
LDKDGEGHKIKEALRHDRWSWWSRWWWLEPFFQI